MYTNREHSYSFINSALDRYVCVVNSGLADWPQEGNQAPIANNAKWVPEPAWMFCKQEKCITSTIVWTPDHVVHTLVAVSIMLPQAAFHIIEIRPMVFSCLHTFSSHIISVEYSWSFMKLSEQHALYFVIYGFIPSAVPNDMCGNVRV
jgi:hypothetical protein